MILFLGVDVGENGGLAVLSDHGTVVATTRMPAEDADLFAWIGQWSVKSDAIYATVERVWATPQMGVVSAFSFGGSYRAVKMALAGNHIFFEEVTPMVWQKSMRCLTGGDKNVSKAKAMELFPLIKVTHAIADALLIAEYGRRIKTRD